METLAPSLNAAIEIHLSLSNGKSVKLAIDSYLQTCRDSFSEELRSWYLKRESGIHQFKFKQSRYGQCLVDLLSRGLEGEPILQPLTDLRTEMVVVAKEDIEEQIQKLPFLMLIPLLLFQFPALILILLGPIVIHLNSVLELQP